MGAILERLPAGGESDQGGSKDISCQIIIRKQLEKHKEQIMVLCGGDVNQYEAMKRLSIGDYIIKLDNWVDKIKPKQ